MIGAQKAHLTLRIGTAFAFLYPPIAALSDPTSWVGYFPQFLQTLPIDSLVLLQGFGIIEVVIALWILSGKNIRIPAAIATLILIAIVGFNTSSFDVVFRDVAIACMTLALAFWPEAKRFTSEQS